MKWKKKLTISVISTLLAPLSPHPDIKKKCLPVTSQRPQSRCRAAWNLPHYPECHLIWIELQPTKRSERRPIKSLRFLIWFCVCFILAAWKGKKNNKKSRLYEVREAATGRQSLSRIDLCLWRGSSPGEGAGRWLDDMSVWGTSGDWSSASSSPSKEQCAGCALMFFLLVKAWSTFH